MTIHPHIHFFSEEQKQHYCDSVLRSNVFNENEVLYYQGKTGNNPHGIADSFWQKASNAFGVWIKKNDNPIKVFPR